MKKKMTWLLVLAMIMCLGVTFASYANVATSSDAMIENSTTEIDDVEMDSSIEEGDNSTSEEDDSDHAESNNENPGNPSVDSTDDTFHTSDKEVNDNVEVDFGSRPTEPEVPTEPTEPEEPEVPTEPTEPEEPEVPTEPTEPEEPETPTEPTEPEEPETPPTPVEPSRPRPHRPTPDPEPLVVVEVIPVEPEVERVIVNVPLETKPEPEPARVVVNRPVELPKTGDEGNALSVLIFISSFIGLILLGGSASAHQQPDNNAMTKCHDVKKCVGKGIWMALTLPTVTACVRIQSPRFYTKYYISNEKQCNNPNGFAQNYVHTGRCRNKT